MKERRQQPDISFLLLDLRILPAFLAAILASLGSLVFPFWLHLGLAICLLIFWTLRKNPQAILLFLVFMTLQSAMISARGIPAFFQNQSKTWQVTLVKETAIPGSYQAQVQPLNPNLFQAKAKATLKLTDHRLAVGDSLTLTGRLDLSKFGFKMANLSHPKLQPKAGAGGTQPDNFKKQILASLSSHTHDTSDVGLFLGITYGDDSAIARTDRANYRAVGISHLTAVSGSNIALVAGTAFYLLAVTIRRRKPAICGALSMTFLYCSFVGLDGAVLRAFLFAVLGFAASFLGSSRASLSLCLSALTLLLIWNPLLLWDIGFVLSAGVTLGLIVLCPPLHFLLTHYIGDLLASFLAVNIVAHLVSLPLSAFYFEKVYPYSFLANLLVAPLVPILLFLGLSYLFFFLLGLDLSFLFDIAKPLLNLIQLLSAHLARQSGSVLEIHHAWVSLVLVFLSLLLSCIIFIYGRWLAAKYPEPLLLIEM